MQIQLYRLTGGKRQLTLATDSYESDGAYVTFKLCQIK